jgi:PAT family beta-lactamase induction signal transducer AmpG
MPAEATPETGRVRGWLDSLAIYYDRRMLVIFLMGFSSGLPLLLGFSTLSYWLATADVDKTTIGLFALVATPYAFKFAWAPLLDHVPLPGITRLLGRRRGWILTIQVLMMAAIVALGATDPTADPELTALAAVAVAFFSASQDIVIDAYRIEVLEDDEQGAGSAATQAGYRFGLLAAGAGALALSDFISWFWVYLTMAVLVLIGMVAVLIGPEPRAVVADVQPAGHDSDRVERIARFLKHAAVDPFLDFMTRPAWIAILLFALLYKFGDAIGGVMANPFYHDIGFSGVEIASVSKVLGVVATLVGVFVGGVMVARWGIFQALLVGGILQAVTNLLFAAQAAVGYDVGFLALVIGADNFTGGLGSAAFVAYLSSLCNVAYTGTQYALLTSLMAFGRTVMSSGGGWLADQLDWFVFFVATTALAIPGLLLLLWLMRVADGRAEPAAR